jgi:FtsH-binding integral membrane protein
VYIGQQSSGSSSPTLKHYGVRFLSLKYLHTTVLVRLRCGRFRGEFLNILVVMQSTIAMIFACSAYGYVTRKDRNVTHGMIPNWKEVLLAAEIGFFFRCK